MFLNVTKSDNWSAKTNGVFSRDLLIWIKSACKITKKIANHKGLSDFFKNISYQTVETIWRNIRQARIYLMYSGAIRSTYAQASSWVYGISPSRIASFTASLIFLIADDGGMSK